MWQIDHANSLGQLEPSQRLGYFCGMGTKVHQPHPVPHTKNSQECHLGPDTVVHEPAVPDAHLPAQN